MVIKILISIGIGIFFGMGFEVEVLTANIDYMIDFGLCLLLFFVGIDIGKNKQILADLKEYGYKLFLLPIAIVAGTLAGGAVSSIFLNMRMIETSAISAGLGWYSLSAIELSKHSATLGSMAFLSNVFREVMAILFIPFIAKYIGHTETIAVAGATSMDTLLPLITKNTSSSIAVVSFFSGVVLSFLVPVLVPFIMGFN